MKTVKLLLIVALMQVNFSFDNNEFRFVLTTVYADCGDTTEGCVSSEPGNDALERWDGGTGGAGAVLGGSGGTGSAGGGDGSAGGAAGTSSGSTPSTPKEGEEKEEEKEEETEKNEADRKEICMIEANGEFAQCQNTATYEAKTTYNECKQSAAASNVASSVVGAGEVTDVIYSCTQKHDNRYFTLNSLCIEAQTNALKGCV
ncbi:hypothetical protein [Thalassomonas actiniarum]|uniref:Uncharacterized protein n=1 Tax=Thalassomonas actiniarum TaxID=485447 RepID=A0AAF0C0P6_9GAMM|nr:hypothetical protein [Thalassomonas actiniarum]WDD98496.1 hypothetical protein SG35_025120 [Thalassomonas actiniarum]